MQILYCGNVRETVTDRVSCIELIDALCSLVEKEPLCRHITHVRIGDQFKETSVLGNFENLSHVFNVSCTDPDDMLMHRLLLAVENNLQHLFTWQARIEDHLDNFAGFGPRRFYGHSLGSSAIRVDVQQEVYAGDITATVLRKKILWCGFELAEPCVLGYNIPPDAVQEFVEAYARQVNAKFSTDYTLDWRPFTPAERLGIKPVACRSPLCA